MTRDHARVVAVALLLLTTIAPARAAELTVSAASSLTHAFSELGLAFQAAHPGHQVRFNHGASGALLQQIVKGGAPVDVFASADQETMDQAQQHGLLQPGTRRDFVSNALVVVVPATGARPVAALGDLAQPTFARVAIGLPASVPVGRYTKGVLESAGLWTAIEPKMVGANNVRQALDYVARGEVDAGFVYATDAALMPDKVKVALNVPTRTPIRYPVAAIAASPHPAAAKAFVDYLSSPPAQAILAKYGFGRP